MSDQDVNIFDMPEKHREKLLLLVYEGLLAGLDRFASRIPTANSVEEMAWVARCLLEIEIWVDYCNASQENAEQFWQDSIRDMHELNPKLESSSDEADVINAALLKKTRAMLTGNRKPNDPAYIKRAAVAISRDDYRKLESSTISKFVHPTALSLFVRDPQLEKQMICLFAEDAARYASEGRKKLAEGRLAEIYSVYENSLRRAREKMFADQAATNTREF
jgi:hypothetical protein